MLGKVTYHVTDLKEHKSLSEASKVLEALVPFEVMALLLCEQELTAVSALDALLEETAKIMQCVGQWLLFDMRKNGYRYTCDQLVSECNHAPQATQVSFSDAPQQPSSVTLQQPSSSILPAILEDCQMNGFPFSQPERLRQWVVNLRREKWSPSRFSLLCSAHFEESCFDRTGQTTRLREDTIPTIFSFHSHLKKVKMNKASKIKLMKACCACGCDCPGTLDSMSFYNFPWNNADRLKKWTEMVKCVGNVGAKWKPESHSVLCGDHFIQGQPSNDPADIDYVPSIFLSASLTLKGTCQKTGEIIASAMSLDKHEQIDDLGELPMFTNVKGDGDIDSVDCKEYTRSLENLYLSHCHDNNINLINDTRHPIAKSECNSDSSVQIGSNDCLIYCHDNNINIINDSSNPIVKSECDSNSSFLIESNDCHMSDKHVVYHKCPFCGNLFQDKLQFLDHKLLCCENQVKANGIDDQKSVHQQWDKPCIDTNLIQISQIKMSNKIDYEANIEPAPVHPLCLECETIEDDKSNIIKNEISSHGLLIKPLHLFKNVSKPELSRDSGINESTKQALIQKLHLDSITDLNKALKAECEIPTTDAESSKSSIFYCIFVNCEEICYNKDAFLAHIREELNVINSIFQANLLKLVYTQKASNSSLCFPLNLQKMLQKQGLKLIVLRCTEKRCLYTFLTVEDCKRHFDKAHTKMSFNCPSESCTKVFLSERALKSHLVSRHTGKKQSDKANWMGTYSCSYVGCSKYFDTVHELKSHVIVEHPVMKSTAYSANIIKVVHDIQIKQTENITKKQIPLDVPTNKKTLKRKSNAFHE